MSTPEAEARPASLDDALDWLRKRFRPDAADGVTVAYRIELTGEGGGALLAAVDRGRLRIQRSDPADAPADAIFRLAAGDFFDVLAGRANPDLLHMAGRLEVEGDLALALQLRKLFSARV